MKTDKASETKFLPEVLNGNMIKVIFKISAPLAIFQFVSHLFSLLDNLMASHISPLAVSTVAYMVQINHMVAALGTGLSVGCAIILAQSYGKGDFDKLKEQLSSVVFILGIIAIVIIALLPFTGTILKLIGTPETFIDQGASYFAITIIGVIVNYFNAIYFAVERTRGRSKKILKLNLLMVIIKLALTALFIYVFNGGIILIAVATLISYLILFFIALRELLNKNSYFCISPKAISKDKSLYKRIFALAIPSAIEKFSFSFGKATINKMSSFYGEMTVGAAGISNNMSGLLTGLCLGFQDGGTTLIGQNKGAGNIKRAISFFWKIFFIQIVISIVGIIAYLFLMYPIAFIFASSKGGYSPEFNDLIIMIFQYEVYGCLALSFSYATAALLFGLGKTKLTLLVNFCRVFVFRIPVLWAFQNFTKLSSEAVGLTMMISNTLTGLFSLAVAFIVIRKAKKEYGLLAK